MFQHILTREREVFWQYGEVTCAAFSLKDLDTVSTIYQSFHFITAVIMPTLWIISSPILQGALAGVCGSTGEALIFPFFTPGVFLLSCNICRAG